MENRRAIVVGGGIVGCVQALLLARLGYRVMAVDASTPGVESDRSCIEKNLAVRSVAMSYRSQQLLESAGLWASDISCAINAVLVNDKGRFGSVRFDRNDYSLPALGYVVRNQQLEHHLSALMNSEPQIEVIRPATAELLSVDNERATLALHQANKDTRNETVELLVAADGSRSKIRTQLGIDVDTRDYQQCALVANLHCQRDHQHVAFERFTDTGPLALLPLSERTVAMVCTLDADDAAEIHSYSDEQMLALLQQRVGGRLGKLLEIGKRAVLPLSLVRAHQQVQGCSVLVGNASITVHPVAGQGLNLALRDVFELASQLTGDHSVSDALELFEKVRRRDQRFVVRQTDWLARVFRKQPFPLSVPLHVARGASLLMLDAVPPLRNRFGRRNAGLDIPLNPVR
ncbi:MAG: FAD-dependent monooxygenase [Pseudomonadota bacterium]